MAGSTTTTTTTTAPCVYNTITLAEGESFILPSEAIVLSATNVGAITSLNDCLDLTNLETPTCYTVGLGVADGDGNQVSTAYVLGYEINGIKYPFQNTITFWTNYSGIGNELTASIHGVVLDVQSCGGNNYLAQYYEGPAIYVTVNTIPSIGGSLKLYGEYVLANTGSGTGYTNAPVEWDFIPISEMIAASNNPSIFDCFNCVTL